MVKNNRSKNNRIFVNKSIRAKEVRCIDKDSQNIGIIPLHQAISLAESDGLDLVQVSPPQKGVPTCRIIDYGKYKFELSKKNKEKAKKQRESAIKQKEITFRPNTDQNDLHTKAKMASKFISDGFRVRVSIRFKGRELSHKFLGEERFNEFISFIDADINIINEPKMDGKAMVALISGQNKKQHVKTEKAS